MGDHGSKLKTVLAHNSSSVKNYWMNWYFCVCVLNPLSCVWRFLTLWTIACQSPLSMGFSRQEYWCGLPCSPPGDLPDLEIEPLSPMSPALAGRFFTTSATWDHPNYSLYISNSLAPLCGCVLSSVQLFATSYTVAHQAPLSMGFPRQEHWSELPFPSPGHLLDPGIKPAPPSRWTDSLPLIHQGSYTLLWLQVKHVFP